MVSAGGFRLLPGRLDAAAQRALADAVTAGLAEAPPYRPVTPGGKPMSVEMSNFGPLGWVTDARGYRYADRHPVTGRAWPPIPEPLLALWRDLADPETPPDACLVNLYGPEARMGCTRTGTKPISAFRCFPSRSATRPSFGWAGPGAPTPLGRSAWPLATSASWPARLGWPITGSTASCLDRHGFCRRAGGSTLRFGGLDQGFDIRDPRGTPFVQTDTYEGSMVTLTRPEGAEPQDFHLSRRKLGLAVLAGYAVSAASAEAEPITTDAKGLVAGTVQIKAGDRDIPAYVARPEGRGAHPTVVVVSEIFGVHEYIRDTCRRLAKAGYAAIAPDFFVRAGDPSTLADFAAVRKIVAATSDQQVKGDLAATLAYLKGQAWSDKARLGVTGFCWGGAVTWLACERFPDFKAGVAWYGRLTPPKSGDFMGESDRQWPIQLVGDLKAPVLGLYAGKDQGIPVADVEAMRAALKAAGKSGSDIVVYPESQHGFHADYRASYDPAAAADGWARMLKHFNANGLTPKG